MFEIFCIGDNYGGYYVVYINFSGDGRVGIND